MNSVAELLPYFICRAKDILAVEQKNHGCCNARQNPFHSTKVRQHLR